MEDFDFDFDNEIGTQIGNIKDKNNQNYTDTDLDYDKIIDNLLIDQTNNCEKKSEIKDIVNNINTDINNNKTFDLNFNPIKNRINKTNNINNKYNENENNKYNKNDNDKYNKNDNDKYNDNDKKFHLRRHIPTYNDNDNDNDNDNNNDDDNNNNNNNNNNNDYSDESSDKHENIKKKENYSILKKIKKFILEDNKDLMIIILIFVLLNTHFIINLINNKVSFIKDINNIYPNLIIRTIIFSIILYILKKYNII